MDIKRISKIERYRNRINPFMDPVSIQAAITDFCFNSCSMCKHHLRGNKRRLDIGLWLNFLDERRMLESVCYAGGDMMTYPSEELNLLMDFHKKKDIAFSYITCGYVKEEIDLLLLREARWIRCSLDTIDEELYREQRGGIKLYKVIDSINNMIEHGVNVELTITVSEITAPGIDNLLNYAINKKLSGDIHPVYGKTFEDLGIKRKISKWVKRFKNEKLTLAPYRHGEYKFTTCKVPYYQIYVDSFGDIYPCCTIGGDTEEMPREEPLGNIFSWNDFLKRRKEFSDSSNLYSDCRYCIDRFGQINKVAEIVLPHEKNFF